MKPFWKREPTENRTSETGLEKNVLQMITTAGEHYYAWNYCSSNFMRLRSSHYLYL